MNHHTKKPAYSLFSPAALMLLLFLSACSSAPKRPLLYPNSKMTAVGKAQASRDIDHCMQLARDYGVAENKDGEVGRKAASGAAIGGASAGAWGLVRGNAAERALAGAAAGAAAGAVKGGMDSSKTNPTFKRFTQKCLHDMGYEVIGWQ
ncbi:MAG: glycine zipper family protein [gamma proteobacterium symbiont of Bathyaustriella thionipta]|nr:glycine zipper family protein [gamma proteobacterium symbiont of Bathyaustriella thionipta]